MTIRTTWLRRTAALLACCAYAGCASLPFSLPNFGLKQSAPAPGASTTVDQVPQEAVRRELSEEESAEVCLATAREMEAHGKYLAAIEQYERARSFTPKRKGIAARLAVLYDRQGNHERAGSEYAAALKEDGRDPELWNDYSYFQFQRGELAEAETSARKALKIDPEHKRTWVNLGLILAEQERYDEAFEAFTKAVSKAAAHNNLGIILARQGKLEDARRELAQAQQLDPTLKQPPAVLKYLADEYVRATQEADESAPSQRRRNAAPSDDAAAQIDDSASVDVSQKSAPIFVNDSDATVDSNARGAERAAHKTHAGRTGR